MPAAVVLLGAQRFDPTLGEAVAELGVRGRIAVVTAGWQEREDEDQDLQEHLQGRTVNLRLHALGEQLFREDPELRKAHRERQLALRVRRDFYRIRLEHALEADRVVRHRAPPPDIAEEQARASAEAVRALDADFLRSCARLRAEFEARWTPADRPAVVRHRQALAELVDGCDAVAIAGGNVATLLNRVSLFGLTPLLRHKPVFAWSGGAMVATERVVLFHDQPPQGPGAPELLDEGLGLVPGLVLFPQPEERLDLTRRDRVQNLAQRFAPARCLALPARSRVTWRDGALGSAHGVLELLGDGGHRPLRPGAEAAP